MPFFRTLLILPLFGLIHCEGPRYYSDRQLQKLNELPALKVLILKHPLSFSTKARNISQGIDHDLLVDFASAYGKKIEFKSYRNEDDLITAYKNGEGHVAAGRFPRAFGENHAAILGPDYESASLSVFCRKKINVINDHDLSNLDIISFDRNKNVVSHLELVKQNPNARIQVWLNGSTARAFSEIDSKKADCLITNNKEGLFHLKAFNTIEFKYKLKDHFSLNWLIASSQAYLNPLMRSWFQKASREGRIQKIYEQYRIYSEELSQKDIEIFKLRTRSRLPEYISLFKQAGLKYDLPWELVAAVCYQESHWDASARSFTGVKGLMQITKSTAADLGIDDIHDPEENILGGARYLKQLIQFFPKDISFNDRVILALAAYNIGIGHLQDAFSLTQSFGKNPYHWNQLKTVLPKLAQNEFHRNTQYGYARGYETVEYVDKTKAYFHYLLSTH
ncbi:MAG: transglycosylase SLT domain-containing protein [Bdellovibrionaceae bacterium]|nr:transglycosylase SLT domain-containing protein [Pseudobdellovibrionaceae bacterium]